MATRLGSRWRVASRCDKRSPKLKMGLFQSSRLLARNQRLHAKRFPDPLLASELEERTCRQHYGRLVRADNFTASGLDRAAHQPGSRVSELLRRRVRRWK